MRPGFVSPSEQRRWWSWQSGGRGQKSCIMDDLSNPGIDARRRVPKLSERTFILWVPLVVVDLFSELTMVTVSFAGMTYLALFLCAKLAVAIPFLNYHNFGGAHPETPARRQAAAPPIYLVVFPLIPICLAIYVSSTRYSDFMHHGFDIISGAILGIASAWLGFRWYHMPITRGGGWAWAPRSYDRAFGKGFGTLTYVNNEAAARNGGNDLERGHVGGDAVPGNGLVRGYKTSEGSEGIHLADMNGAGLARESNSSRRPLR